MVVLIAAFVVWFEIPRVRIRNYIKENLPEGHYTLYPNYGDYIISDSTRFHWSSVYNIGGAFADRKELDDLYVAAKFYEEKNVPASYGVSDFQYTNYKEFKNVNSGLFRIGGTLEDIEAERTEAYYRMIDIGMEYNDEEILSQFTQEEMDGYVPYLERIK